MNTAIILGSSRSKGNTSAYARVIKESIGADLFDLNEFTISPYRYDNRYQDDFSELIDKLLTYKRLIFASPMYWYSASGQMKVFMDRLSDLLGFEKDKGRLLRGKSVGLIATGADKTPPTCFEQMFAMSFQYLGMKYHGMNYCSCPNEFRLSEHQTSIEEFVKRIQS